MSVLQQRHRPLFRHSVEKNPIGQATKEEPVAGTAGTANKNEDANLSSIDEAFTAYKQKVKIPQPPVKKRGGLIKILT